MKKISKICWDRAFTSYDLDCPVKNLRYVGAHNTYNFKNDRQIEIFIIPRFLIKMLNFSILDHIYIYLSIPMIYHRGSQLRITWSIIITILQFIPHLSSSVSIFLFIIFLCILFTEFVIFLFVIFLIVSMLV